MKHIFIAHNNTTRIVISSAVHHLKIPKNDVIIFTENNSEELLSEFKIVFHKRISLHRRYRFKRLINKTVKEDFLLYTPHNKHSHFRVLRKLSNCLGYYYIEEGLGAYNESLAEMNNSNIRERTKNYLLSLFKPVNLYNELKKYKGCLKLSEGAFFFLKKVKRIPVYIPNELMLKVDAPLFVFDNLIGARLATLQDVTEFWTYYLKQFKKDKLLIKFHPSQKETIRNKLVKILNEQSVNYQILADEIIIEYLVLKQEIELHGVLSSLLVYNKVLSGGKNRSISFINSLKLNNKELFLNTFEKSNVELKSNVFS